MKTCNKARSSLLTGIKNLAAPIGCGCSFLFLLRFVLFFGYVPSPSMEPATQEGSFITGIRFFDELRRGDVVVFKHDGNLLVKRIAGIRGDTVCTATRSAQIVPQSCYYMLGDNKDNSCDSRYWDEPFIPRVDIIAVLPAYSRQLSNASHLAP